MTGHTSSQSEMSHIRQIEMNRSNDIFRDNEILRNIQHISQIGFDNRANTTNDHINHQHSTPSMLKADSKEPNAKVSKSDIQINDHLMDDSYIEEQSCRRITPLSVNNIMDEELSIGMKIMGNYQNEGTWYKGVITKINTDETYGISYEDGDEECDVAKELLKLLPY
jgi:hypothetical protein